MVAAHVQEEDVSIVARAPPDSQNFENAVTVTIIQLILSVMVSDGFPSRKTGNEESKNRTRVIVRKKRMSDR